MITDYFLRFNSKEEALQVFSTIPEHTMELDNSITITQQTENFAIDEVGEVYKNDAVYDKETMELIQPPTKINGYHYNYRLVYGNKPEPPLPVELEPYLVNPKKPQRTFF